MIENSRCRPFTITDDECTSTVRMLPFCNRWGKTKLLISPLAADCRFRAAGGDLPADPAARLQSGALEGSNVGPVETMVAMIAAARQFHQQMKVLQGAEQRDQGAARLLGPSA